MSEDLETISEEFRRYRGNRGRVKYPQSLWDRALKFSKVCSIENLAKALGVSVDSLRRHIREQTKVPVSSFIPVKIECQAPIQIHIDSSLPIRIDFHRSVTDLADLIQHLQKGETAC